MDEASIIYQNYSTYSILGQKIFLFSEKINDIYNTVAEIEDSLYYLHYLGNEPDNLTTAVFAWEDFNSRSMTQQELKQVLTDNHIL